MEHFLESSDIIDFDHHAVAVKAQELSEGCDGDAQIVKRCFEFVRDEIRHTGDAGEGITTLSASEVLEQGQGWCYAKSHLLAALLRANGIPTALCYQRLSINDDGKFPFSLHGLNAVYLKEYGWYWIDPRGNKAGINAQFDPPYERLAFELGENEYDLPELYSEPLDVVIKALQTYKTYTEMVGNFPDLGE
ncbi:MAG: Cro/Cl family transcriptional regulator [Sulfuricurvum sp. MLSB]|uniref:transglutaminase-like domain-containing protein n=1 Tax=unclassified Sulfuricurvum TaxID=2632390 RepID=UPI000506D6C8|nr:MULTISPECIES: transglutaminase-like domain-containing protein [unclassified Sulfuricurvum]KFN38753.1 MAG: Cro/Cl family transcriptional regulator [Sulfuricurvum sp. MLSB]